MNKHLFRFLIILAALSFAGVALLYPQLPQVVPTSWGLDGNINGWGHRWVNLMLGSLPLAATVGLYFLPRIDPRRKNYGKHSKAYGAIVAVLVVALIIISWVTMLPALGITLPVERLIPVLVGVMMIGMGNYMPRVRSNFFMGIRTPWALSDDVVWQKTHRAGGFVFCAAGILMVLFAFLPASPFLLLPIWLLLAGVAGVYVYSYLVYRGRHGPGKPRD